MAYMKGGSLPVDKPSRGRITKVNSGDKDWHYLDSYNRVTRLESKKSARALLLLCAFLLVMGLAEFSPWPMDLGAWSLSLGPIGEITLPWLSVLVLILLLISIIAYNRRQKICQYCGRRLEIVQRPLVLKNELLARPGLVIDGTFYTLMGYTLMGRVAIRRRWMKLHQLSQACHYCRVYETRHFKTYEPLTPGEEERLHVELDKQY